MLSGSGEIPLNKPDTEQTSSKDIRLEDSSSSKDAGHSDDGIPSITEISLSDEIEENKASKVEQNAGNAKTEQPSLLASQSFLAPSKAPVQNMPEVTADNERKTKLTPCCNIF